ncbi:hypothetical protein STEG23_031314 [Scotinomys teguina]
MAKDQPKSSEHKRLIERPQALAPPPEALQSLRNSGCLFLEQEGKCADGVLLRSCEPRVRPERELTHELLDCQEQCLGGIGARLEHGDQRLCVVLRT